MNVYCPFCNGAGSFRAILFVISGHAKEKIGVHFEPFVPEGGNILVHGKSKVRYPHNSTSVADPQSALLSMWIRIRIQGLYRQKFYGWKKSYFIDHIGGIHLTLCLS
jgi:hypothetical protein